MRRSGTDRSGRRTSIVLLPAMVLSMAAAACGSNAGSSASSYDLGALMPLTGPYSEDGGIAKKGINLAVRDLERGEGAVDLKMRFTDNQADPQVTVSAFNQLLSLHDVPAATTTFSGPTLAIAPIATQRKVALINTGGVTPDLAGASPYLFHLVPLISQQIEIMMEYLAANTDAKTVALMYSNDALGQGAEDVFADAVKDAGMTSAGAVAFDPEISDYRAALNKLQAADPDVVYTTPSAEQAGQIIQQGAEIGFRPLWCGYSGFGHQAVVELGGEAAEGSLYTAPTTTNAETGEPFDKAAVYTEAYRDQYGEEGIHDYFSQTHHTATKLFAAAIQRLVDQDKEVSGENIAQVLRSGTFDTLYGPLEFRDDGTSIQPVAVHAVEDGKFVTKKVIGAEQVKQQTG